MERAVAYLISVGIAGFGLWVIAAGNARLGPLPIWLLGILPVLVGLVSIYIEIRNDRHL
jgi:hypothetical protein